MVKNKVARFFIDHGVYTHITAADASNDRTKNAK